MDLKTILYNDDINLKHNKADVYVLYFYVLLPSWQVSRFTTWGSQTPAISKPQNGIHNTQSHATVTYNSTMLFLTF